MKHTGKIELIFGPMFSGKSSELMRRIRRYKVAKKNCLVIKYKNDARYSGDNLLSTHDLQKIDAIPALKLADIADQVHGYDCIGIDEAQFVCLFFLF